MRMGVFWRLPAHLVLGEYGGVDWHTHSLHLRQNRHQRHLHIPQRLQKPFSLTVKRLAVSFKKPWRHA